MLNPIQNVTPVPISVHAHDIQRVGIVDIGSNSVRLVIYDKGGNVATALYKEKTVCRLGKGLDVTGRLNPQGVIDAKRVIARFMAVCGRMGVAEMYFLATAAVRDAVDGNDFARQLEAQHRIGVQVLSAREEAQLVANTILYGDGDADGVLFDLGGRSLDLMRLNAGQCGSYHTAPLGHLTLHEASQGSIVKARKIIRRHLACMDAGMTGRVDALHAVGGVVRTIAKYYLSKKALPFHIVDNLTLSGRECTRLCKEIIDTDTVQLATIDNITTGRAKNLPIGSLVLRSLVQVMKPKKVVFSGYGMCEGKLLDCLPPSGRAKDPLLFACHMMSRHLSRFHLDGMEVYDWITSCLPPPSPAIARLQQAAALLSDMAWSEHPDYRAEHAFLRALRMPVVGLDYSGRVFIAVSLLARYGGDLRRPNLGPMIALLPKKIAKHAIVYGYAMRIAHAVGSSFPQGLAGSCLFIRDKYLVLELHASSIPVPSSALMEQLRACARMLNLKARLL